MNRCTEAIVDIHGIKWYYPEICVDGGIFRAKNTYTNLTYPSGSFRHTFESQQFSLITETGDVIAANNNDIITIDIPSSSVYDPMPYSGHFYGIRKYTGLAPNLPYFIDITGKTGSSAAIEIPSEILEIEYNKNDNYGSTNDYSGFRLESNLYASGEFGKSIASQGDLLAIGCPKMPVISGNKTYNEAGKVFLYRRNPRPTTVDWPLDNYKSSWTLEKELTLPSGLLGDYSVEEDILIAGLPPEFVGTKTSWFVGQDGRQFGHSVDVSVNSGIKSLGEDKQEILVVGGVGAKWDRTFDDDQPTPVSVGLMIFTDEFSLDTNTGYYIRMPTRENPLRKITYEDIVQHISGKDLIFNYFANPRVKFDVKIMLCIMTANSDESDPEFPDKPSFITLNRISKNAGYPLSEATINNTVSGITSSFLQAFPYTNAVNSGIPPILGLCFDGSFGAGGREALEPAIDKFIDFYKVYSLSGVKDFYGVPSVGSIVEYSTEQDINWIEMSKSALNEILDTGNLVQNNQVRFFASNIGTFNKYDKDFNVLPDSGGKVYIFEKESGSWNLIQEIRSPNVTREYNDRFGHAVSISDNGEVLVVGSPYISEAVTVYERNYEARDYFYDYALIDWIQRNRAEKYKKQLTEYFAKPVPGLDDRKALYLSLDQEDKFKSRLESNIEEYQKVYTFDHSNMQPLGSWSFVTSEYAPTSRLGYSVDVNEDGSVVVAGAPTDSLNLYNDGDVYYAYNGSYRSKYYGAGYVDPSGSLTGPINSAWSSSLYAGSAHVFESRKYYPHNKAIEYGALGNLHENISTNTADSGHFGYLSGIFSDKNFEKTPFDSNFKIPKDVGLTFIITPAESRLNDEIYNNILEWLALGDRNLVLVGNDPIWEASGQYSRSNEIINAILTRLQSRMRIIPARNRYESLPEGYSSFNNVIPSFVPQGSTSTYVQRSPVRASGVADIKIYYPGYYQQMPCNKVNDCTPEQTTIQIQTRCEMPLINYGDLRAQWNASCCTNGGLLVYGYNWPFLFGSYKPACGDTDFPNNPMANFEPIPLLVAAEKTTQEIVYPAIPETSGVEILYDTLNTGFNQYYEFGSQVSDNSSFSYKEDSLEGSGYNSISYNVNNLTDTELFYRPKDLLGGVLQARATPKIDNVPYISKEIISDKTYFCLEYSFKQQETSKIIIIPSLKIESQLKAGSNDENILFYQNLVSSSKIRFGESSIAQLNWGGSDSFVQSYDKSLLRDALLAYNAVTQNVGSLDSSYNVAWFPNATSEISEENINNLTQWLSSGSKKFILTYDGGDQSSVKKVISLCNKLGIKLELLTTYTGENATSNISFLSINQDHQIGGNYFTNTKLKRNISYFSSSDMIVYPLKLNAGATALAYVDQPIYDDVPKEYVNNTWDLNPGIVKINVPVLPGSGYKLLVTIDSLDPYEAEDLTIDIDNVSVIPTGANSYPDIGFMAIYELNKNRELTSKDINSSFPSLLCGGTCSKEFQVGNTNNINIYISCTKPRLKNDNRPKSKRLIGISGVLVPIYDTVSISTVQIPVGVRYYKKTEAVEESREIIEVIRPISTDNTKYCTSRCEFLGNQLIEDGPMIVAQELEILSSFDAGFKRSRITVITDSSILQGRYVLGENGTVPQDTYDFIRSLYPETEFFSSKYGRQFNVYNKLISPERGSPNKYHSKAPSLGLNKNFGNFSNTPSDPININESNYIPQYINRPKLPWEDETDEKKIKEIRDHFLAHFASKQSSHACLSKISGVIGGVSYSDASIAGGVPKILKEKGYDYLDLDRFPSGYLGDLFGYSVSVRGKSVLVGSPFSAIKSETTTPWSTNALLSLANDGGAGAAYMFEKSVNSKWESIRKFKPESLMGQLSGVNVYSDHFGYSLNMHNDVIIIGAPSHSYGNYYNMVYESGSFSRKNFNPQFDIPQRLTYDLGISGIRNSLQLNNSYQKNIGAIYLYENKITDWENKQQSWELVEKIISNYSKPSGEKFGKNIYLSRPYRSDSDYSVFAGCNFASGTINNVGVAYAKDIMLRSQRPSTPNIGAWISAKVFGYRDIYNSPTLSLNFSNSGDSVVYYASGVIITNNKGEIFLEVSGQDPSTKGFISHRPYIQSIYGYYQYGKLLDDGMPLFIESKHVPPSSNIPLYINVENSANVYNTLGLYNEVKDGSAITSPSGLYLFAQCSSGNTNGHLILYSSGNGYQNDSLNLRVRGY